MLDGFYIWQLDPLEDVGGVEDNLFFGVGIIDEEKSRALPYDVVKTDFLLYETLQDVAWEELGLTPIPNNYRDAIDAIIVFLRDLLYEGGLDPFIQDYLDANGYYNTSNLPTNLSSYTNDVGFITSADIPTNLSSYTNDVGFITSADIPTDVSAFTNNVPYLTDGDDVSRLNNDPPYVVA